MDSGKFDEYVKSRGVCCACERFLSESRYMNMVGLDKRAEWEYPTWGNIYLKEPGRAVSVICDECAAKMEGRELKGEEIKYAIEWDGQALHYHLVNELVDVPSMEEIMGQAKIKFWETARQAKNN